MATNGRLSAAQRRALEALAKDNATLRHFAMTGAAWLCIDGATHERIRISTETALIAHRHVEKLREVVERNEAGYAVNMWREYTITDAGHAALDADRKASES